MTYHRWLPRLLLLTLGVSSLVSAAPVAGHQTQTLEGWTVQIDDRLLASNKAETDKALEGRVSPG